MIEVPRFSKASEAARWIAKTLNKDNWVQGYYGKRDNGDHVSSTYSTRLRECKQLCALGWIYAANQGYDPSIKNAVANVTSNLEIYPWNDHSERQVEEVKEAFEKAATLLEREETDELARKGW